MEFYGKKEMVYCVDKPFPIRIGYSLATVYITSPDNFYNYKLLNFGYCPSDNSFYYNRNIHLPKKLINYFEHSRKSEEIKKEMEELGILDQYDVESILNQFNKTKKENEIAKLKTLNLKTTLRYQKNNKTDKL